MALLQITADLSEKGEEGQGLSLSWNSGFILCQISLLSCTRRCHSAVLPAFSRHDLELVLTCQALRTAASLIKTDSQRRLIVSSSRENQDVCVSEPPKSQCQDVRD